MISPRSKKGRAVVEALVREDSLAFLLGVPGHRRWSAAKGGGPVHLWLAVKSMKFAQPACEPYKKLRIAQGTAFDPEPDRIVESFNLVKLDDLGEARDPATVRRLCFACRKAIANGKTVPFFEEENR